MQLSGAALETPLSCYEILKSGFALRDFLHDDLLVGDFVDAVSRFVTVKYVELRRSGTLYT